MINRHELPRFPLIITGSRCEPVNGDYMDVVNPESGETIAQAAMASTADLDLAVATTLPLRTLMNKSPKPYPPYY
jgi:hypothetical protein